MRSDALRRHCKAKHSCSDVVDKMLANGYKFRRDVDRSNLLVSLKTEGSKDNCGYCFDCHTQITMPAGQCPNKLAVIQRHQCRVVKERKKRSTTPTPTGKFVGPVAPFYKLTEEDLKEFKKVLDFDIEVNDDLTIDFKKSRGNLLTAMRTATQALKDAKETGPSISWKAIATKCQDALPSKYSRILRQRIVDGLRMATDFADEEEGIDEDEEHKAVLVGLIHTALDSKPTIDLTARVLDLEAALDKQTIATTDMANSERVAREAALAHYKTVCNLEAQNRQLQSRLQQLEAQLKEQTDKITHTD